MVQAIDTWERPADTEAASWEPRVTAFVCNWCSYAAADMAGTTRRTYAPNVRVVRLLCTGQMDPFFIIKAFEQGADGVLIAGCHPGDCHYVQGNLLARRRFTVFRALMEFLGLDDRRLHFAWVSASEGLKWARLVDEAVGAIRLAGPLRHWGAPSKDHAPWSLPSPVPGAQVRQAFSSEEAERTGNHLQQLATNLLEKGSVSVIIGYTYGPLPGQMVPVFVTTPEEATSLAWNENCANNLIVYLHEALTKKGRKGKVGVVVKSCDAGALLGLLRENQLSREDVVLLGISCAGVQENGELALKCYACQDEVSPLVDWTITPDGSQEVALPSGGPRERAPDPRDAQIASLEALSPQERWDYWQQQFERCLRCYACRAVCPLCYCETCIADKHRPRWIPTTFDGPGNTAWNVARAMHLAGRCVGCDECARVCPADIRLDLINRRVALEIESQFGYRSGDPANVPAPLTTFRPNDPDNFH